MSSYKRLKFSERIIRNYDIPEDVLKKFDKYLEDNEIQWTILMDGAENMYAIFALKGEDLMTDGVVVPPEDIIADIEGCVEG